VASILSFLNKISVRLNQAGLAVAATGLIVMMALTGVDVMMRYFLNRPITGSMELYRVPDVTDDWLGLAYLCFKKGTYKG